MKELVATLLVAAFTISVSSISGHRTVELFGYPALALAALLAFGLQWLAFVPAAASRSERSYDLVGGLSFLAVLCLGLLAAERHGLLDARRGLLATLIMIWATRLSVFLFARVRRSGGDGRFDAIKVDPGRFLLAWTLQGAWVMLSALPALIQITATAPSRGFGLSEASGLALWLVGFALEVTADRQKSAFNQRPENVGRFIERGLWSRCQHPNYLGEILLWSGVFVYGAAEYEGLEWLALLSPLFVYGLLTRVSGIPLLDARAARRWGADPDYQRYRRRTPLLWPRLRPQRPSR